MTIRFIEVESTENWTMHFNAILPMIPYFVASGQIRCAKRVMFYVQKMFSLSYNITREEFDIYVHNILQVTSP